MPVGIFWVIHEKYHETVRNICAKKSSGLLCERGGWGMHSEGGTCGVCFCFFCKQVQVSCHCESGQPSWILGPKALHFHILQHRLYNTLSPSLSNSTYIIIIIGSSFDQQHALSIVIVYITGSPWGSQFWLGVTGRVGNFANRFSNGPIAQSWHRNVSSRPVWHSFVIADDEQWCSTTRGWGKAGGLSTRPDIQMWQEKVCYQKRCVYKFHTIKLADDVNTFQAKMAAMSTEDRRNFFFDLLRRMAVDPKTGATGGIQQRVFKGHPVCFEGWTILADVSKTMVHSLLDAIKGGAVTAPPDGRSLRAARQKPAAESAHSWLEWAYENLAEPLAESTFHDGGEIADSEMPQTDIYFNWILGTLGSCAIVLCNIFCL